MPTVVDDIHGRLPVGFMDTLSLCMYISAVWMVLQHIWHRSQHTK